MTEQMEHDLESRVARIDERTSRISTTLDALTAKLDSHYITRAEFQPVQRVVYGLVGTILLSVVGALIALVLHK